MKVISLSLEASQVEILKNIAREKGITVSQAARSLMESVRSWALFLLHRSQESIPAAVKDYDRRPTAPKST